MDNLPVEYQEFWKKWNDFDGKSNIRQFWIPVLINFVVAIILGILGTIIGTNLLGSLFGLLTFIPGIAVMIRRLHDSGHSGWNVLWILLPIPGWIILIIFLIQESK